MGCELKRNNITLEYSRLAQVRLNKPSHQFVNVYSSPVLDLVIIIQKNERILTASNWADSIRTWKYNRGFSRALKYVSPG